MRSILESPISCSHTVILLFLREINLYLYFCQDDIIIKKTKKIPSLDPKKRLKKFHHLIPNFWKSFLGEFIGVEENKMPAFVSKLLAFTNIS